MSPSSPPGDRKALAKLIEAARIFDDIFMDQFWSGNPALYAQAAEGHDAAGQGAPALFLDQQGPVVAISTITPRSFPACRPRSRWARISIREDMTKEEFEAWVKTLSKAEREQAEGFFTVIRRDAAEQAHSSSPTARSTRADLEKRAHCCARPPASPTTPR